MIDVEGLSFRYPGSDRDAIGDVSFRIGQAEVFGFLGPSGAGKSTTQRILTGVLDGWQGRVTVDNQPLRSLGAGYRAGIGVSFEFPNVYTRLTARENLDFFASLYPSPTRPPLELLELVGLRDVAEHRVGTFSKGMRMRLNLARAFVNRPRILFLDEPTSGLDPANARVVKDLVRSTAAEGAAVFITTHDMGAAAELCDRVGFLADGRLREQGPPRDLMVAHGRRVVRVEFRDESGKLEPREFPLDGLGTDPGFARLLTGGRVETIHTTEATLEDVFLKVTGRRLT